MKQQRNETEKMENRERKWQCAHEKKEKERQNGITKAKNELDVDKSGE